MFDLIMGPYEDLFVFDKYAIVLKEGGKTISTVYFDQFRYGGKQALPQYEKSLYDDLQYTNHKFERITFWDQSGNGDYLMLGAIRSPGAITIHPFSFTIDTSIQEGVMEKDDSLETYLMSSAKITAFEATKNFLVVGCATCDGNKGWLKFYNPRNAKLIKGIPGSAPQSMLLGQLVQASTNADMTDQVWYSSKDSDENMLVLNSIIAFQDLDTEKWVFDDKKKLHSFASSQETR